LPLSDAAEATNKALRAEKTVHRVFNITGGDENYASGTEFHRIMKRLVPGAGQAIFTEKGRHRGKIDISLAQEELGYSPRFSLGRKESERICRLFSFKKVIGTLLQGLPS